MHKFSKLFAPPKGYKHAGYYNVAIILLYPSIMLLALMVPKLFLDLVFAGWKSGHSRTEETMIIVIKYLLLIGIPAIGVVIGNKLLDRARRN